MTPSSGRSAPVDPVWISLRSGQPATVRATSTDADAVGTQLGATDHAEVDDRAVQLGVLDGTQRLDELLGGDWHRGWLLDWTRGAEGAHWRTSADGRFALSR